MIPLAFYKDLRAVYTRLNLLAFLLELLVLLGHEFLRLQEVGDLVGIHAEARQFLQQKLLFRFALLEFAFELGMQATES